ncbi:unnamed protein product [Rotaria sp. Silwood1]|nr:unnamed protein product [Rotaria sp. Silwood1]
MICNYLTPIHILKAFYNYDNRIFSCISDYRQNIDLTKYSYSDLQYFLQLFVEGYFRPTTLTVSNNRLPTQIQIFTATCDLPLRFRSTDVHHLSLIECTNDNIQAIKSCVQKFKSLQSLRIVESASNENNPLLHYDIIEKLRNFMLDQFVKLELSINQGIILDNRLHPNKYLKQLIISLQKFNDLFVLFDGLVPNLVVLNVTICQSDTCKRLEIPKHWPREFMLHLVEFRLKTNENVTMNLNYFRSIVMPLSQLQNLTIDVRKWFSHDQQFVRGNHIEMLINEFMPRLCHFHCFIQTMHDINMQSFTMLNKRWLMACRSTSDNLQKHLYTIPWPFEQLHLSMLADDDTESICPNVQHLIVDVGCINLSRRFPNVHTLIVLPQSNLTRDDFVGFRHLRHLTADNIEMASSPLTRHIHTLTLSKTFHLLNNLIIYPNVRHLILTNDEIDSLVIITALVQYFPNLYSIKIQLKPNTEYYDCLNLLLDGQHLPNLILLKTNWFDQYTYCSNIQLWIAANTPLEWKLTPFYGHCGRKYLTICL